MKMKRKDEEKKIISYCLLDGLKEIEGKIHVSFF